MNLQAHFRAINGTSLKNFEGHLAEILWRNWTSPPQRITRYFGLVRTYYTLKEAPCLSAPKPLFYSWCGREQVSVRCHYIT